MQCAPTQNRGLRVIFPCSSVDSVAIINRTRNSRFTFHVSLNCAQSAPYILSVFFRGFRGYFYTVQSAHLCRCVTRTLRPGTVFRCDSVCFRGHFFSGWCVKRTLRPGFIFPCYSVAIIHFARTFTFHLSRLTRGCTPCTAGRCIKRTLRPGFIFPCCSVDSVAVINQTPRSSMRRRNSPMIRRYSSSPRYLSSTPRSIFGLSFTSMT